MEPTALLLARRGWDVAICHRGGPAAAGPASPEPEAGPEAVIEGCRAEGVRAIAVVADVAREADVERLFATVDSQLGPIGALINNAGIVGPRSRLDQLGADRLERMFAVNVTGSFLCAREAVRRMSSAHGGVGGAIVNVSSVAARLGSPDQYIDYAASKAAIDTMTIGLAKEVAGEGIRVNAVRPGVIRTGIHARGGEPDRARRLAPSIPIGRAGEPAEIASAIVWLCSTEASYVTGAILDVGGGR
jgi:NAD(P)-dependent dehydrogenase (short-subunit alcohol dehydrogenase family)